MEGLQCCNVPHVQTESHKTRHNRQKTVDDEVETRPEQNGHVTSPKKEREVKKRLLQNAVTFSHGCLERNQTASSVKFQ